MRVLVFDTETTGLPTNNYEAQRGRWYNYWGHIVQLSWVLYDTDTNNILQKEDKIIKLPESIELPQESVNIHGITREIMDHDGIEITDALSLFRNALQLCNVIVGHNIDFDINMVRAEMIRSGAIDYFLMLNVPIVCTMKSNRKFCKILTTSQRTGRKYYKYPKLMELHEKLYGCVPANLHNALVDVIVCLRCYMKREFDVEVYDVCYEAKKFLDKIIEQ
jgi:DNA polymerase III epsilon subunit-like protein